MRHEILRGVAAPLAVAAVAAALAGCNRGDVERSAEAGRDRSGDVVAQVERKGEQAVDKAKDMAITTAVNAELARDSQLSALRINVDTYDGRVVLRGTAPDQTSRSRAAQLALGTNGVVSVDNQLNIDAPK